MICKMLRVQTNKPPQGLGGVMSKHEIVVLEKICAEFGVNSYAVGESAGKVAINLRYFKISDMNRLVERVKAENFEFTKTLNLLTICE